jgi:hypothetical protein
VGSNLRKPFHWLLEFPEVFLEGEGFSAIVGNPPFKGGAALATLYGADWREHIVDHIGNGVRGRRGQYDLCAFFALRCKQLLIGSGTLGLITINSFSQGDTKAVGLTQLLSSGYSMVR